MFKRYRLVFLLMGGIGTFLLLALVKSTKNGTEPKSNLETTRDRPAARNSDVAGEEPATEIARESSRHSAGEVARHLAEDRPLLHLKEAVRDQEKKVKERRKVLATLVRTNGAVTVEEANMKSLDAQDYVDAKRDFETDLKLLEAMKLKLVEETVKFKK